MRCCPHCGCTEIDEDAARGDATCTQCGTVLEESIVVSENQFQERAGGLGHALIGQFVSTERAAAVNPAGVVSQESREVTYAKGRKVIEEIASQLRIKGHRIDTAFNFFKMCVSRNLTRGRTRVAVAAVCLYITCRLDNTAHLLLDFSDVTQVNVYDLGRNLSFLARSLKINLPSTDPCLYIIRFACLLELGEKQKEVVNLATRLVQRMKRDWMSTGRRPTGICGAALLIAARSMNFNRTVNDVVRIVHISESVVRKRLDEFSQTASGSLTIDEFSTIDLDRSEDPPAFREARRRAREEQLRKESERAEAMEHDLRPIEQELELALEKKRKEKFKNSPYAKLISAPVDGIGAAEERLVRDDILETVYQAADEAECSTSSHYEQYRPSLVSLGIKSSESTATAPASRTTEPPTNEDDDIPISDSEIDTYILNEKEVEIKTNYWMKANGEVMEALEERRRQREANGGGEVKRKRRARRSEPMPMSAMDAIEKVIHEKKLSNKVNYEMLKEIETAAAAASKKQKEKEREISVPKQEVLPRPAEDVTLEKLTKTERSKSRKNQQHTTNRNMDALRTALNIGTTGVKTKKEETTPKVIVKSRYTRVAPKIVKKAEDTDNKPSGEQLKITETNENKKQKATTKAVEEVPPIKKVKLEVPEVARRRSPRKKTC